MHAFVVDDELLACRQLKHILQEIGIFQSIDTFTDPEKALDQAKLLKPDVVFLDIEMPEISGIELAELLQADDGPIQIVFTTAYDEFAIKAFELNAIDYLLKPILKPRLEKAVTRLIKNRAPGAASGHPQPEAHFGIECFDSLKFYKIEKGTKSYIPVKWRTSRARELYAYLLKEHGRFVSKERLIDLLWPGMDDARGTAQLYTTIYQIRKLMEKLPLKQRIIKNDIGYSLSVSEADIDIEQWQVNLNHLPPITPSSYQKHMTLFHAYKNHYFNEYGYLWAEAERVRLLQLWLELANSLAEFLIQEGKKMDALNVCQQVARLEPDDARNLKLMIRLYNETGNVDGAIRVYERYKEVKDT
ncbi:response regulator [Sporolactobacillus sp. CPB3-1]|uniref:Response regulator n=1 Tax=Sporolactobacillus mangiferae TaxID=2940498 RepID=A0ABT0M936_9BACL|nr:response regulator [Sporolactobacillus mangiferae]MCL1631382.1 response regulator [Sporolactobacillus mangiferae]